jgi:hypothetical protein
MVEVEMTETQEQLIRSIEQQLENLMHFDDDLAYQYDLNLYYDCNDDEEPIPIVEAFTPELLKELEDLVYQLDTQND